MRIISIATLSLIILLISPLVSADNWYSGPTGYDHWRYSGGYQHLSRGYPGRHRNHYRRNYRDSYFGVSFGYGHRPYYARPYRYNHHRHSDLDAGSLLGGIVIGSLLSNTWQQASTPGYRPRPVVRAREVITVNNVVSPGPRATERRRLLRDLAGNCFEISYTASGDELRTQLNPSICDY